MPPVIYNYKMINRIKHPIITLGIRHSGEWITTDAYVDSGAYYSVFNSKVAESISVDYQKCQKVKVRLADGKELQIYLTKHVVQIGAHRIKAMIGFYAQLDYSFNVLGRRDIFDYFKVCFDEKNFQVAFYPPF